LASINGLEPLEVRALLSAQVQIVRDIAAPDPTRSPFFGPNVVSDGRLIQVGTTPTSGEEFWIAESPGAELRNLQQIQPGRLGSQVRTPTNVDGVVFYIGTLSLEGPSAQLWKLDPRTGGTEQLTFFPLGQDSVQSYSDLTAAGNMLYFFKNNPGVGTELWKSDGTRTGTQRVALVSRPSQAAGAYNLTAVGGTLYFVSTLSGSHELWQSDGTEAGTIHVPVAGSTQLLRNPMNLTSFRGRLYFEAWNETFGGGLWASDGTPAGTVLVSGFGLPPTSNPGSPQGASVPSQFLSHRGLLYMSVKWSGGGAELWVSDGTTSGTVLVKDIYPGGVGSSIRALTEFGNDVYFGADDGVHGLELWKTDGTNSGTIMVRDLRPGPESSGVQSLLGASPRIYFFADDGVHGLEPWVADGTAEGTHMVADLNSGPAGSTTASRAVFGELMYFSLYFHSTGNQVWVTDGTEPGTRIARPWPSGSASSDPNWITVKDDAALFVTQGELSKAGLWRTDGTNAGTVLLREFDRLFTDAPGRLVNNGASTLFS
jgi:ELWxxDGT repeat protein